MSAPTGCGMCRYLRQEPTGPLLRWAKSWLCERHWRQVAVRAAALERAQHGRARPGPA